ncbi:MAG: nucleotide pyrophosphohydrolase [Zetaproteobacteria bacterium]|nr:nucleotide pyrophosphohydrolase [Pseudobdellovibrionaceae bacterium]|tara:strand:- start:2031 stop:2384 length:354 start_codon:yes stop_codon:yes gene_type:complete
MNYQELQDKIMAFAKVRDWDQFHSPKNLSMALSVETSELMEHFMWMTPEESKNLPDTTLSEVKDEIGDVMIYLTNLASRLNINLLEAAHQKLEKAADKYPQELVKGKSLKYSKYNQK